MVHGWALTNEAYTHDVGRANVGVAELLEAGHQAGQARPHIRRTRRADHLNIKNILFKYFYGGHENVNHTVAYAAHLLIFESGLDSSVADLVCLSRFRIFFPCRIPQSGSKNKKRLKNNLVLIYLYLYP